MKKTKEATLIKERLRLNGRFTQRWLAASDEYYLPIAERLFYAQWAYLTRKAVMSEGEVISLMKAGEESEEFKQLTPEQKAYVRISCGWDYYTLLQDSINSLNRSFSILIEAGEVNAAMALIRLQLDNLTYLLAELKYPFRVLQRVYFKNENLSEVKIAGKNLSPAAIRKEADEQHGYNLCEMYATYSSYVTSVH